jgi:hypothetical protein
MYFLYLNFKVVTILNVMSNDFKLFLFRTDTVISFVHFLLDQLAEQAKLGIL